MSNSSPTRLIFAGTPEFAAVSLQALIDNQDALNIDIVAVYTQPDRKAGRGQKLTASPVKQLALAQGIAVEQPATFRKSSSEGMAARDTLAGYAPDVMVVAAYGLILPLGVLNTPTHGCLNIHASLLPRWRGAAPIHRAILAGDVQTGITIMQMNQGLDTGDVLYTRACDIAQHDTSATLHDRLAKLGGEAITTVLSDLTTYQANAQKQDDTQANYADKLTKDEAQIDWSCSASEIDRHIRGLQPWPVAYTFYKPDAESKSQRVRVLSAAPAKPNQPTHEPAGLVVNVNKQAVQVACGDGGIISLTSLQWAGGKALTAEQIAVSQKVAAGARFESFDAN